MSVWKNMFDHVTEPTINHIQNLLNEPKMMRKCKYLCLVGGLSTSPYFQQRMRAEFGMRSRFRLEISIPERPILSVVTGAAYMGIVDNYIKARVLKYTYGQTLYVQKSLAKARAIPQEHINKNLHYDEFNDEWLVDNIFEVIARKNDKIRIGEVKRMESCRLSPDQTESIVPIYYSTLEDPRVHSEGRWLVTHKNKWTKDTGDVTSISELHFAETLIKVVTYRDKDPSKRQIGYIMNCGMSG